MSWARLLSNSTIYKGDTVPLQFALFEGPDESEPLTNLTASAVLTVVAQDNAVTFYNDLLLTYQDGIWSAPVGSTDFDAAASYLVAPGRTTILLAQIQVTSLDPYEGAGDVQTLPVIELSLALTLGQQTFTAGVYTVDGGAIQNTPTPWGTYNPDSPWKHFFCSPADVLAHLAGVDTRRFEADLSRNMPVPAIPGLGTLGSWISYLISLEESAVESDLNQAFRPTQKTIHVDGNGEVTLYLPFYPILSVQQCILNAIISVQWYKFQNFRFVDSLGYLDDSYISPADLLIDSEKGSLTIPPRILYLDTTAIPFWNYTFLEGDRNVTVTWTYGFANPTVVPDAFRQAVAMRVAIKVLYCIGMKSGEGASEIAIENVRINYARNHNLPYSDLFDRLDMHQKSALNKWKNIIV